MKKNLLIISVLLFSLYSCEVQKPLYKWSNYDESSYNYLKRKDKKSTDALIKTYQKFSLMLNFESRFFIYRH